MAYNKFNNEDQEYPQPNPQSPSYGWKPDFEQMPTQPPAGGSAQAFFDPEDLTAKNINFSEESIRKGFIRKVYLILMGQLLVTLSFVVLFAFHEPSQKLVQNYPGILLAAVIVTLVVIIAMACCDSARRVFPTNLICLGVFTLAESILVGGITSLYDPEIVLLAVGITAVLCLALSIFAMQTKYDFTVLGGFVLMSMICLIIFGIVAAIWRSHILNTVYAGCGALLGCVYLIYDTQLMMGGEHKYSISPEEYIFAALNLYLDVIRIFIYVLHLLGSKK